jgi:hypothetical protein
MDEVLVGAAEIAAGLQQSGFRSLQWFLRHSN